MSRKTKPQGAVQAATVLAFLLAAGMTPLHAGVSYIYTGNLFTLYGGIGGSVPGSADFVSITMDFADALPADLPLSQVTPTFWSATDQVNTLTSDDGTFSVFELGTDASGAIDLWSVDVAGNSLQFNSYNVSSFLFDSAGQFNIGSSFGPRSAYVSEAFSFQEGTWVDPSTPEPATWLLAGGGILLLARIKSRTHRA